MAQAQPDRRLRRIGTGQGVVNVDRRFIVARVAQRDGLQVAVCRIGRIGTKQPLQLGERLLRLVHAIQHDRVVVARGVESGCEFQAALEQALGIFGTVQPHRHFGKHADGDHIGRRLLQLLAQARFGFRNAVVVERRGRGHEDRVVDGVMHMAEVGGSGGLAISADIQMVGKDAPDLRLFRRTCGRLAQRGNGNSQRNPLVNRNGHAPSHTCTSDKA